MSYPEAKRYPELYKRLNKNSGVCFKNFLFYVFETGDITYTDDIGWYVRNEDGKWKKDYEVERRAMDAAYGIVEIPDDVVEEYGFKAPVKGIDIE